MHSKFLLTYRRIQVTIKKIMIAAAIASAAFAAPAMANENFTGARVEVTAGVDDAINNRDITDVTYGATVGVDFPVGDKFTAGVEANVDNVFDRRDVGASVRLGYVATPTVLLYGKAGYANYKDSFSRELDGLRAGAGVEVKVSKNTFVGAEYRYSDFEANTGKHGVFARLGLRF